MELIVTVPEYQDDSASQTTWEPDRFKGINELAFAVESETIKRQIMHLGIPGC